MEVARGVKRSELPVGEPYIWIEKSDEIAASGALNTRIRRRAKSKSVFRD
jgi:hypothetical protein